MFEYERRKEWERDREEISKNIIKFNTKINFKNKRKFTLL